MYFMGTAHVGGFRGVAQHEYMHYNNDCTNTTLAKTLNTTIPKRYWYTNTFHVPSDLNVCCFKLVDQIAALVTWLHGGTWLDELFLGGPKVRSSSHEKDSYTWSEMRDGAFRASPPTGRISETHNIR